MLLFGISPNDIEDYNNESLKLIEELAKNKKVVAIGEIGLDYYWEKENKELQKEAFIKQIELANKLGKPIVIHTREAVADTIDILKNKIQVEKKGIFHCCPLNPELIKEGVKLGFYISFSGNVTFKNAKSERAVKEVPLDKLLIETDSPYLSPEPLRGKRNDSRNVKFVAEKISNILERDIEDIAKITYENTNKIFNI
jgi:TatD DNase family protein